MPVRRPHDKLFRTVFAEPAEAAPLLRAHLPEPFANDLRWSSLTVQDASFVDDQLRDSEADLLFSIERTAGDPPAWLYVLLEHQSKPDPWTQVRPQEVRGELQGRIAQLMMMAPFRHRREALRRAVRLLAELLPTGGRDAVGTFVLYLLATQDRDTAHGFGEELRAAVPEPEGDLMTYAEELIREGREQGRQEGRREGEQHGLLKGRLEGQLGTIEDAGESRCSVVGDRSCHRHRPGRLARSQATTRSTGHRDRRLRLNPRTPIIGCLRLCSSRRGCVDLLPPEA